MCCDVTHDRNGETLERHDTSWQIPEDWQAHLDYRKLCSVQALPTSYIESLHIDYIGPLPVDDKGNSHILVRCILEAPSRLPGAFLSTLVDSEQPMSFTLIRVITVIAVISFLRHSVLERGERSCFLTRIKSSAQSLLSHSPPPPPHPWSHHRSHHRVNIIASVRIFHRLGEPRMQ